MIDNIFFQKIGFQIQFQHHIDEISAKLYDKGENLFLPLDGPLTIQDFIIPQNTLISQIGSNSCSFITIKKQEYNQRVMILKVNQIWNQLPQDMKEDLQSIANISDNKLLQQYKNYPIMLYPYLTKVILYPNQHFHQKNSILFLAEGELMSNGSEKQYFEGEIQAKTYCRIYALNKSNICHLQYFDCEVKPQFLSFRQTIHSLETPKVKPKFFFKGKLKNIFDSTIIARVSNNQQENLFLNQLKGSKEYYQSYRKPRLTLKRSLVQRGSGMCMESSIIYNEYYASNQYLKKIDKKEKYKQLADKTELPDQKSITNFSILNDEQFCLPIISSCRKQQKDKIIKLKTQKQTLTKSLFSLQLNSIS